MRNAASRMMMAIATTPIAIPAIAPLASPEEDCKDASWLTVGAVEASEAAFVLDPLAEVVLIEARDVAVVEIVEAVVVANGATIKALVTEVKTDDADEATTLMETTADKLVVARVADKAVGTLFLANTPATWVARTLCAI